MKIIGLHGESGSGKDHIGRLLFNRGYYPIAYATIGKIWLISTGSGTYEDFFITKPADKRDMMQEEFTRLRDQTEENGTNVWITAMHNILIHMEKEWSIDKFVITDIRFLDEASYIHNMGGKIYKVLGDSTINQSKLLDYQKEHRSENELANYKHFAGIIQNGTDVQLEQQFINLKL